MSANFDLALTAAQTAASSQHYPTGALYVVASPIGNLADISLRAIHTLNLCDTLACEDTRHSQTLLRAYGIDKPASSWLAVHQHNEAQAAEEVVRRLHSGQRVAYLSDAGTPAVSDPGARLVWLVQTAGFRVVPIPGASSITALLSVCGTSDPESAGFVFHGFLPTKATARAQHIDSMSKESRAQVLLEAPHRIEATAQALAVLGKRWVTLGRELTKQFEEVATVRAEDLPHWLLANSQRTRGEFAIVVHAETTPLHEHTNNQKLLTLLLAELPLKVAVKLAAEISGEPKNALYEQALALKKARDDE